tara:strand:- start:983 stop:1453 length:471 start_codon:yes stop_codon:yes gene_type:complete
MSYKNSKTYVTKMIELSLSSDQSITSTSATLVNFDSIRGDSGHGVSLVSGQNGRLRLSANNHYYIVGAVTMDKDLSSDQYSARWYDTSGTELNDSQGAFKSYETTRIAGSKRHFQCLHCQLIVNPTIDTDYDLKIDGETGSILSDGTRLFVIEMSK